MPHWDTRKVHYIHCDHSGIIVAYYLEDRYLSLQDTSFVELVEEDVNDFLAAVEKDRVLLFPPVNSYQRLLIHKTVQRDSRLHSFSVGEGDGRQTVVCWKDSLISDPAEFMSGYQPPPPRGRGRGRLRDCNSPSPNPGTPPISRSTPGSSQPGDNTSADRWDSDAGDWTNAGGFGRGRAEVNRSPGSSQSGDYTSPGDWRSPGGFGRGQTEVNQSHESTQEASGKNMEKDTDDRKQVKDDRGSRPQRTRNKRPDMQVYVPRGRRSQNQTASPGGLDRRQSPNTHDVRTVSSNIPDRRSSSDRYSPDTHGKTISALVDDRKPSHDIKSRKHEGRFRGRRSLPNRMGSESGQQSDINVSKSDHQVAHGKLYSQEPSVPASDSQRMSRSQVDIYDPEPQIPTYIPPIPMAEGQVHFCDDLEKSWKSKEKPKKTIETYMYEMDYTDDHSDGWNSDDGSSNDEYRGANIKKFKSSVELKHSHDNIVYTSQEDLSVGNVKPSQNTAVLPNHENLIDVKPPDKSVAFASQEDLSTAIDMPLTDLNHDRQGDVLISQEVSNVPLDPLSHSDSVICESLTSKSETFNPLYNIPADTEGIENAIEPSPSTSMDTHDKSCDTLTEKHNLNMDVVNYTHALDMDVHETILQTPDQVYSVETNMSLTSCDVEMVDSTGNQDEANFVWKDAVVPVNNTVISVSNACDEGIVDIIHEQMTMDQNVGMMPEHEIEPPLLDYDKVDEQPDIHVKDGFICDSLSSGDDGFALVNTTNSSASIQLSGISTIQLSGISTIQLSGISTKTSVDLQSIDELGKCSSISDVVPVPPAHSAAELESIAPSASASIIDDVHTNKRVSETVLTDTVQDGISETTCIHSIEKCEAFHDLPSETNEVQTIDIDNTEVVQQDMARVDTVNMVEEATCTTEDSLSFNSAESATITKHDQECVLSNQSGDLQDCDDLVTCKAIDEKSVQDVYLPATNDNNESDAVTTVNETELPIPNNESPTKPDSGNTERIDENETQISSDSMVTIDEDKSEQSAVISNIIGPAEEQLINTKTTNDNEDQSTDLLKNSSSENQSKDITTNLSESQNESVNHHISSTQSQDQSVGVTEINKSDSENEGVSKIINQLEDSCENRQPFDNQTDNQSENVSKNSCQSDKRVKDVGGADNQSEDESDIISQSEGQSEDDESWDAMFDDNGDCLDASAMEELTKTVGKVKIQKSKKINYLEYQPKDKAERDYTEYGHIIEIYDFPKEFVTRDLITAFQSFMSRGFDLKWVDDTHALGIFTSAVAARDALDMVHPLLKVCPLSEASRQSQVKARDSVEFLQPYKARPETSATAARRLVAGALGLATNVSREKRDLERKQLREAKDKRRQDKKNREDIWEGTYGKCAMDEEN